MLAGMVITNLVSVQRYFGIESVAIVVESLELGLPTIAAYAPMPASVCQTQSVPTSK